MAKPDRRGGGPQPLPNVPGAVPAQEAQPNLVASPADAAASASAVDAPLATQDADLDVPIIEAPPKVPPTPAELARQATERAEMEAEMARAEERRKLLDQIRDNPELQRRALELSRSYEERFTSDLRRLVNEYSSVQAVAQGVSRWRVAKTKQISLFGQITEIHAGTIVTLGQYGAEGIKRLRLSEVELEPLD